MNKADFISQSIPALEGFSAVVTVPQLLNTNELGDRLYKVNVRFVKDSSTVYYYDVKFVVVDADKPTEATYYFGVVPSLALISGLFSQQQ